MPQDPLAMQGLVESVLAAEREAISEYLAKYHQNLLGKFVADLRAISASGIPDKTYPGVQKPGNLAVMPPSNDCGAIFETIDTGSGSGVGETPLRMASGMSVEEPMTEAVSPTKPESVSNAVDDVIEESMLEIKAAGRYLTRELNMHPGFREDIKNRGLFVAIADHPLFEGFFNIIVLVNTLVSALDAQYHGFEIGFDIGYPGYNDTAEETWPGGGQAFPLVDTLFACVYGLEMLVKIAALRLDFFRDRWHVFDFILVAAYFISDYSPVNPALLRLCRIARLMRLVRHIGWLEGFDSLHMLICGVKASFSVLIWASILLFLLFCISALAIYGLLYEYLEDKNQPDKDRSEVFKYFGTFTRSLITVFNISFASHALPMRCVMENVHESYAILFMLYKCVVSLSVMKIISGVFLHETFRVCSEDDELMVIQKRRAVEIYRKKMDKLINKASGGDSCSKQQFMTLLSNEWVQTWLAAMELDTSHVHRLWKLLDDGDGMLTAEELVRGVAQLKGPSKSVDVNHAAQEINGIFKRVGKVEKGMERLALMCEQEYKLLQRSQN